MNYTTTNSNDTVENRSHRELTTEISVLCVSKKSNYFLISNLDLWTIDRDCFNFTGKNKVIAHPPCAQWSQLRGLSNYNLKEKLLLDWCYEIVTQNGGILEHPLSSSAWKRFNIKPFSVNLHWFGFAAKKPTGLFFKNCSPTDYTLNFNAITHTVGGTRKSVLKELRGSKENRNITPLKFNQWLVDSITNNA